MSFELCGNPEDDNGLMLISHTEMLEVIHPTMQAGGMGAWVHRPQPEPEPENFNLHHDRRCRLVGRKSDLQAYWDAWDLWSREAEADFGERGLGIPLHKLASNDDWEVTPAEIASALPHAPAAAFWPDGSPAEVWPRFLAFLRAAGPCGFNVT